MKHHNSSEIKHCQEGQMNPHMQSLCAEVKEQKAIKRKKYCKIIKDYL